MSLSKEQNAQLLCSGFTQRQINTMSFKFGMLLNTVKLPEPAHLRNIAELERQLEAANELIRLYWEESSASARRYPFPIHLENPEFRLLFETAQVIENLGKPEAAVGIRNIAARLQDEWLRARSLPSTPPRSPRRSWPR